MFTSVRIAVEEQSQTAEARRIARKLAEECGFDEVRCEQVAIVVTEVCTNLLKHADGGEILLRKASSHPGETLELELLALDKGPGMANLEQCQRDGYSTGGSPGQGLGAITRLSTTSDFYSQPGHGTAVLARWSQASSREGELRIGAINVCKPGQEVCGDSWGVNQTRGDHTFLMADGLGHGPGAQTASLEAVRILHANPSLAPGALLERTHQALRSSRGAAVGVARIDLSRNTLTFAGAGNIAAQIYSGSQAGQHLVSVNGTAGHELHKIREFSYAWPANGLLVMHSDGLSTHAALEGHPGLALRDPSLIAGVLYRDFSRRNDDATVVIAKAA